MLPIEATVWKDRFASRADQASLEPSFQADFRRPQGRQMRSLGRNFILPSTEHAQFGGSCAFVHVFGASSQGTWYLTGSLLAPAGLRRTDLGPRGTVGTFFKIPRFQVQMPRPISSGSPAPCISVVAAVVVVLHRHQLTGREVPAVTKSP